MPFERDLLIGICSIHGWSVRAGAGIRHQDGMGNRLFVNHCWTFVGHPIVMAFPVHGQGWAGTTDEQAGQKGAHDTHLMK